MKFLLLSLLYAVASAFEREEELLLVVEVSRHGARSPTKLYNFAVRPEEEFKNVSQLTFFGRKQHYQLGEYIRQRYIEELKFISSEYDEREVYVQTTYLSRTYLSALYQLMGMYPNGYVNELDFQKYQDIGHEDYLLRAGKSNYHRSSHTGDTSNRQSFLIHQVNQTKDFLLHLDDSNCERFHLVHDLVKQSDEYKSIARYYLEQYAQPHLTKLLGLSSVKPKELTKLCGYIQWARYENLETTYQASEEDQRHCLAVGDSKLYYNAYGLAELWKLSAYEFLNTLIEFTAIVKNNVPFSRAPFFSKYFRHHFHQNLAKKEVPMFPKFIHYAAHAETLGVFLEGLGIRRVTRVPPGGALFIEFVKREGKLHVRFYLYGDVDNYQSEPHLIKELRLPGTEEGKLISGRDFVSYLKGRLATEGHLPEYLDIECKNLNFSIEHELEAKRRLLDP